MSKKLLVAGVVLAFVAVLVGGVAVQSASADAACLSMVNTLVSAGLIPADKVAVAQAACGVSAPAACSSFTRDLTVGSTGADVTALQTKLGVTPATGYFGAITKAAVVAYQTANGIAPAAGYVGPMTRGALNACAVVPSVPGTPATPGTPAPMSGDEGSLKDFDTISGTDSTVEEGQEDVKVLGVDTEADDSDMMITRVDVDISTASSTGSSQLDDYITEVSLMIDGEKVATKDVDDYSDEENDIYSFRFTGLDSVVKEDKTSKIYVLVSGVNNIDGDDDGKTLNVTIPEDGVRAVDGAGITETYVQADQADTFSVGEVAVADVTITESSDNPDTFTMIADADNDSDEYEVLAFDIDVDDAGIQIETITVLATSTGSGVGEMVKDAILVIDGEEYEGDLSDATTATTTSYVFDIDGDIEAEDGDTLEAVLKVVLNAQEDAGYATSSETLEFGFYAADLDAEDVNTGDDADVSGSAEGDEHQISLIGVDVTMPTKTLAVTVLDDANNDYVTGTIKVSVKNNSDEIVYLPITASASTTASSTAGISLVETRTTATSTPTVVVEQDSDLTETGNSVKISKGQTAIMLVTVTYVPTTVGTADSYKLTLDSVNFSEAVDGYDLTYTAPDTSSYRTSTVTIVN